MPEKKEWQEIRADGKPNNRKEGKSEVYPFWNIEDIKAMADYFLEKEWYHHYLAFMLGLLLGRRIGDTMRFKWSDFYWPNGRMKDELIIKEEKTSKSTNPWICKYAKSVIKFYLEKTGINPRENNYQDDVFPSTAAYREAGYRKAFKQAAVAVGIKYPVSTHSTRKTFGYWSRQIHPRDVDSIQILQRIFAHSDPQVTLSYIGLSRNREVQYFEDNGDFIKDIMDGGKPEIDNAPVVTIKTADLREVISAAYNAGREGTDEANPDYHIQAINKLMTQVEEYMV